MINRTEAGLSKAQQDLESLQDEAKALNKSHANDNAESPGQRSRGPRPPAIAN